MGQSKVINDREVLFGKNAPYRAKNLSIEAGAGAGKTNYIINKIVDELLQGVEPKRFVVITFTNKATEEMLTRITNDINKRAKEVDKYSLNEIEILKRAKEKLFEMNVSTIHSFCNKLLNENSFKSKLSYGANLIEEDEEEKRNNKLFYEWQKTLKDVDIANLTKDSENDLLRKIKTTYDCLTKNFDNVKYDDSFNFNIDGLFDSFSEVRNALDNFASEEATPNKDAEKFIEDYDYLINKFGDKNTFKERLLLGSDEEIELILKFINSFSRKIKFKPKDCEANNDLASYIENAYLYKTLLNKVIEHIYTPIINRYALSAWQYYKDHRGRETLSNNQLIYETYLLLENNPKLCDELANKYDVIFIDEFQDTDKCQIDFVIKLAKAIYERKEKENIKSTSLVVVGDPKQSIYRFRGADFNSFSKVQADFESLGKPGDFENIFFPDNFRSNNYIINYVNHEFATRNLATNYIYQPMLVSKQNEIPLTLQKDKLLAGVYSYPFNNDTYELNKFQNLARFIKHLVDEKYHIPQKIYKDDGSTQIVSSEIKYSDFLVLSNGHKEMSDYVEALNSLNIPSQVSGEFDLSSSECLRVIYRILCYLLDKQDNNKSLARKTLEDYVENVDEVINQLEENVKDLSPYATLLYVINNLTLIFNRFEDSDELLFNATSNQLFEKLAVNEFVNGIDLLNRFDELLKESSESEIILDPSINAVRIMNIHKSKGLEGHIVIIVDSGAFNTSEPCKFSESILYLNNISIYPDKHEKAKEEINQERTRLEYVGITRSEQVLIFESEFKDNRLFNLTEKYDLSDDYLKEYRFPDTSLPTMEDVNEHYDEEENNTLGVKVNFNGFEKVNEIKKQNQIEESSPSKLEDHSDTTSREISPRRPFDNVFGTVFHKAMELYVKNSDQTIEDIILTSINENISDIDKNEIDKYKSSLKECLNSVITLFKEKQYFNLAKEIKPEFKFIDFDSKIYQNKDTLMTGSIDLLMINKDGSAVIFDYKTDIAKFHNVDQFESLLIKSYSRQLETYSKVVNKLFGIKNIETKIIWMEETENSTIAHEIDLKI